MKKETIKQIIEQMEKYELTESFPYDKEFEVWVLKLNSTQVNNFLSLDIDIEEIRNVKNLLINNNLLNCEDYKQRVEAISKLKNGDGCWHLFSNICKPNFLKSENFYKDLEMLSKADTARYGLWILGEDTFINSPYHVEDLKLLVEAHDTKKKNHLDWIVSDAIATVAGNADSIKSPYHQFDMNLIATAGSNCLQPGHSYPECSLNNLAINKVSLEDKYHLENMKILAENPNLDKCLYEIMTDPNFVKGKNYRYEVEAIVNAKSKRTARALYYYIVNPDRKYIYDRNFFDYCDDDNYVYYDYDKYILDGNSVAGNTDPDYIDNLVKINKIDDNFVMYFVSLLMNSTFINSQYKKFDLELLQNISDKSIFLDLYHLMTSEASLSSLHHKRDAIIISQAIENVRRLLLEKAIDEFSLNNNNYDYDMEYISRLELDSINETIYDEIYYYLFNQKGMNDPQHREKLEKLLQGILVERDINVLSHSEDLQKQLDDYSQVIEVQPIETSKPKSRILSLFTKKRR